MATSFLRKLDAYPPVRCRLVAVRYPANTRYQWPVPLTDEEIAARCGFGVGVIRDISSRTTWDNISVLHLRTFLHGCRLNFDNWSAFARTDRLARREKFHYLRRHPLWKSHFEPLVQLWLYVRSGKQ